MSYEVYYKGQQGMAMEWWTGLSPAQAGTAGSFDSQICKVRKPARHSLVLRDTFYASSAIHSILAGR